MPVLTRLITNGCLALVTCFSLSAQDVEIRGLVGGITEALHKASKETVAVVDFTDLQGNVTDLGRYLAEELSVALAASASGIEVVDRGHLRALLQENKLAVSGVIDPSTAMKLGQIAGVQVLITGSITPFGDHVRFSVKALDTRTARIISASTLEIAKTKSIEELLDRGVTSPQTRNGQSGGGTGNPPPTTMQSVETFQLRFAIESCRLEGSSAAQLIEPAVVYQSFMPKQMMRQHAQGAHVTCRLTVQNKGDDRDLTLYGRWSSPPATRLIDNNGVETIAEEVQIGGKIKSDHVSGVLVAAVPTVVVVGFDGVPSNISLIALLDLSCSVEDGRHSGFRAFKVQFRAISVVR